MFHNKSLDNNETNTQGVVLQLEELRILTMNMLLEARKKIDILENLKKIYPNSKKINEYMHIFTQAINFGEQTLSKIAERLSLIREKQQHQAFLSPH